MAKAIHYAKDTVPESPPGWLEPVARAGYASKGVVYVLVGILAFMSAFGLGGAVTGPKEALETLLPKTFGKVILGIVALGLLCYAAWRFVQAIYDPDGRGKDAKGKVARTGFAVSGVILFALAWAVGTMVLGSGGSGSGTSEEGMTAKLMAQPFGVWLVGLVGVIIAGVAAFQFYKAFSGKFKERLNFAGVAQKPRELLCRTCQAGLIARGVTFLVIAWFFIRAAMTHNSERAGGLAEALGTIAAQPYGPWLLGLVGLGLVAYGVYAFVQAKFRKINV